nr:energy transducer TonB [Thiocystis violacea]
MFLDAGGATDVKAPDAPAQSETEIDTDADEPAATQPEEAPKAPETPEAPEPAPPQPPAQATTPPLKAVPAAAARPVVQAKPKRRAEAKPKPKRKAATRKKRTSKPARTPPRVTARPAKPSTSSPKAVPRTQTPSRRGSAAQGQASTRDAGQGRRSSGASDATKAADERGYLSALRRAISRQQRYPASARRNGETGTAFVSFVIQGDGRLSQIRIAKSSGNQDLDQAALQAMYRLGRFKPIPKSLGRRTWALRVPVRFSLK